MGSRHGRAEQAPPPPRPIQPAPGMMPAGMMPAPGMMPQPPQPPRPMPPPMAPLTGVPPRPPPAGLPPGIRAAAIARTQQEAFELDAADGVMDGKFHGAEIRVLPHVENEVPGLSPYRGEAYAQPSYGGHHYYDNDLGGEIVDIQYRRLGPAINYANQAPTLVRSAPVTMPVTVTRATPTPAPVTVMRPQQFMYQVPAPTMTAGFPPPTIYRSTTPGMFRSTTPVIVGA